MKKNSNRKNNYFDKADTSQKIKKNIKFNNGSLKVPKILLCYLRDMTTTVNGTAAVFHYDGQPSEIDLTLIFQEYRALSRQDVEAGF